MYSVQPVYTVQCSQNCTKLIKSFLRGFYLSQMLLRVSIWNTAGIVVSESSLKIWIVHILKTPWFYTMTKCATIERFISSAWNVETKGGLADAGAKVPACWSSFITGEGHSLRGASWRHHQHNVTIIYQQGFPPRQIISTNPTSL